MCVSCAGTAGRSPARTMTCISCIRRTAPCGSSEGFQNGSQPPTERLLLHQHHRSQPELLRSTLTSSAPPSTRSSICSSRRRRISNIRSPAGSVTEPGSSPNAMAVAAICWQNNRREDYSSQGPTIDGRIKPDIAGQSVVSSASFGGFGSCPGGCERPGRLQRDQRGCSARGWRSGAGEGRESHFHASPDSRRSWRAARPILARPARTTCSGLASSCWAPRRCRPSCSPRPTVSVQASISGGRQNVLVTVSGTNNRLLSIGFSSGAAVPVNALLDLPDGRTGVTGAPTWTAGPGTTQATFYVRRQNPGAPVTVPFTVH